MKTLGRYFLRGLLVFAPIGLTVWMIWSLVTWTDRLVSGWLDVQFFGAGLVVLLLVITGLGIISSVFIIKPLIHLVEGLIERMPLIKIVYTSLKDLFSSFFSEEKKFNKPVVVKLSENGPHRLGFLTDPKLEKFDMEDMVSVYLPHSYNFSGNLYILPKKWIRPLEGADTSEVMKYIVSGGVTEVKVSED
ncbi:MAG: DUF502 domain-containing protein [Bacteroidota bacterium]